MCIPMREASPVSGGASRVASKAPLERAMSRLADGPPASRVTDCLGMFHSLRASPMESSWAPPKATMPTFLPIRSVGWRIFFCATRLKGKLVSGGTDEHEIRSLTDSGDQRRPVRLSEVRASPHQGLSPGSRSRDHDKVGSQAIFCKETEVLGSPDGCLTYAKAIIADQEPLLGDYSCWPCAEDQQDGEAHCL